MKTRYKIIAIVVCAYFAVFFGPVVTSNVYCDFIAQEMCTSRITGVSLPPFNMIPLSLSNDNGCLFENADGVIVPCYIETGHLEWPFPPRIHENENDHKCDEICPDSQDIVIDEIQCRESLTLVTKNDGSPACVKEQTLLKLVERQLIITSKAERDLMLAAGYKLYPGVGWVQGEQEKQLSSEPEPERDPVPEGNYVDKNTYVNSVNEAESYLNYTLSTPYLPEGTDLEKIKISSDRRKATIYYSNGLEVSYHPMGINFNSTHYVLNPEREAGKVFYDFGGTFAEGLKIDEPDKPFYSTIKILRDDRIYVRATMETGLDDLLKMIEPMDLNVPHVPYTPTPDYVMGAPEPEPIPEPKSEPAFPSDYPRISQNDMYCWTQWWYVQNTVFDEEKLVSSLRSTISMFGPDFDIPNREITVSHNDEETVISIGDLWTKDKVHHEKLTSVIKNHMDGSELIRDNIVMCA